MMKVAAAIGIVVIATAIALPWLDRRRGDRAVADHLERLEAFAARHVELTGTLPPLLDETSGLAVSRTQPGVLWTHNDSGDGPHLYAFEVSGAVLGTFTLAGAAARDWEDMSSGPCAGGLVAPNCLYLADIGDNSSARPELTVYVVAEPKLSAATERAPDLPSRSFRFRYPTGADDAEALAVMPDGDVLIVSKGRRGTIDLFRLRGDAIARAIGSDEVLTAEYVRDSGIPPEGRVGRLATGADLSPDGSRLAVRTYYEVFFYDAVRSETGLTWRGPSDPCVVGNAESQGEAIAWLDNTSLLLTSERGRGAAALIHRLQC